MDTFCAVTYLKTLDKMMKNEEQLRMTSRRQTFNCFWFFMHIPLHYVGISESLE